MFLILEGTDGIATIVNRDALAFLEPTKDPGVYVAGLLGGFGNTLPFKWEGNAARLAVLVASTNAIMDLSTPDAREGFTNADD